MPIRRRRGATQDNLIRFSVEFGLLFHLLAINHTSNDPTWFKSNLTEAQCINSIEILFKYERIILERVRASYFNKSKNLIDYSPLNVRGVLASFSLSYQYFDRWISGLSLSIPKKILSIGSNRDNSLTWYYCSQIRLNGRFVRAAQLWNLGIMPTT